MGAKKSQGFTDEERAAMPCDAWGLDRSPPRMFSDPLHAVVGKSTGSVTIDSPIFENRGTVELGSGTLRLGGYNQLSGATRLTVGAVVSLRSSTGNSTGWSARLPARSTALMRTV